MHHLKLRLHAGERHKAERSELRLALPVGLVYARSGEITLDPDEEVQSRVRLVFAKFEELGTANAVVRYFRRAELLLPSRPLRGPAPHDLYWQPATCSAVLSILNNPAYAGTYVYGRQATDPTRRKPGRPYSGKVPVPIDRWPVLIHNHHPGYISWDAYLAHRAQLRTNHSDYSEDRHGVPRKGQALLRGIAICARCGGRMSLHYSGPQGEFPVYKCDFGRNETGSTRCQEVRALGLDSEVERLVLEAWHRTRLLWPWPPWSTLSKNRPHYASNGNCVWNAFAMKLSGHAGSITPWNRKIVWWPAPWSMTGKKNCAQSRKPNRNTSYGSNKIGSN